MMMMMMMMMRFVRMDTSFMQDVWNAIFSLGCKECFN